MQTEIGAAATIDLMNSLIYTDNYDINSNEIGNKVFNDGLNGFIVCEGPNESRAQVCKKPNEHKKIRLTVDSDYEPSETKNPSGRYIIFLSRLPNFLGWFLVKCFHLSGIYIFLNSEI